MPSRREFALFRVAIYYAERLNIDIGGQDVGYEEICGYDLDVIIPNKCPDREIGALSDSTRQTYREGENGGG